LASASVLRRMAFPPAAYLEYNSPEWMRRSAIGW
jgi:hypothetical protein